MAAVRSKLTKKVIEAICAATSIGATHEIAAEYAGVSLRALQYWLKDANELAERIERDGGHPQTSRDRLLLQLLQGMREAQANAAIGWLDVIDRAARDDPRWARFMLKTRYREYSDRGTIDVTSGGSPVRFTVVWDSDDERDSGYPDSLP